MDSYSLNQNAIKQNQDSNSNNNEDEDNVNEAYPYMVLLFCFSIINIALVFLRIILADAGSKAFNVLLIYSSHIMLTYMIIIFIVNNDISAAKSLIITIYVFAFIFLALLLIICFCGEFSCEDFGGLYCLPFTSISLLLFIVNCKYFDCCASCFSSGSSSSGGNYVVTTTELKVGGLGGSSSSSSSCLDSCFCCVCIYFIFLFSLSLFGIISYILNVCCYYVGLIISTIVLAFIYIIYLISTKICGKKPNE